MRILSRCVRTFTVQVTVRSKWFYVKKIHTKLIIWQYTFKRNFILPPSYCNTKFAYIILSWWPFNYSTNEKKKQVTKHTRYLSDQKRWVMIVNSTHTHTHLIPDPLIDVTAHAVCDSHSHTHAVWNIDRKLRPQREVYCNQLTQFKSHRCRAKRIYAIRIIFRLSVHKIYNIISIHCIADATRHRRRLKTIFHIHIAK